MEAPGTVPFGLGHLGRAQEPGMAHLVSPAGLLQVQTPRVAGEETHVESGSLVPAPS